MKLVRKCMNKKIKSIILAAGKGTRMKSETSKVLHKIFDKELLGYVIDAVNETGVAQENFVIVGHQAEAVKKFDNVEGIGNIFKVCLRKPAFAVFQNFHGANHASFTCRPVICCALVRVGPITQIIDFCVFFSADFYGVGKISNIFGQITVTVQLRSHIQFP